MQLPICTKAQRSLQVCLLQSRGLNQTAFYQGGLQVGWKPGPCTTGLALWCPQLLIQHLTHCLWILKLKQRHAFCHPFVRFVYSLNHKGNVFVNRCEIVVATLLRSMHDHSVALYPVRLALLFSAMSQAQPKQGLWDCFSSVSHPLPTLWLAASLHSGLCSQVLLQHTFSDQCI